MHSLYVPRLNIMVMKVMSLEVNRGRISWILNFND